jgi:hypothetical protein
MNAVTALWRHPIKSHGREALESIPLIAGQTIPWDRHWAVTHEASQYDTDNPTWVMCRNFMIGAQTPALCGIWAQFDEATQTLTLSHADQVDLTFQPETAEGQSAFLDWVTPLCDVEKRTPTALVSAGDRGMTDTPTPTVSIMNSASHAAVEAQIGAPLETARWRGNIWLDGPGAWEELNWVGHELRIGNAVLKIIDPITRCMATAANPHTGQRDQDTLGALRDGWGHQYFGVYAEVITSGTITCGDPFEVL